MSKGSQRQLVYYWFEQRGMKIANEYVSKMYLLRDAMFKNRTDGALVRLTTPIYPTENEADADKRLQEFTRILLPSLSGYLPAEPGSKMKPAMTPANGEPSIVTNMQQPFYKSFAKTLAVLRMPGAGRASIRSL